jgi:hypothetical protein
VSKKRSNKPRSLTQEQSVVNRRNNKNQGRRGRQNQNSNQEYFEKRQLDQKYTRRKGGNSPAQGGKQWGSGGYGGSGKKPKHLNKKQRFNRRRQKDMYDQF